MARTKAEETKGRPARAVKSKAGPSRASKTNSQSRSPPKVVQSPALKQKPQKQKPVDQASAAHRNATVQLNQYFKNADSSRAVLADISNNLQNEQDCSPPLEPMAGQQKDHIDHSMASACCGGLAQGNQIQPESPRPGPQLDCPGDSGNAVAAQSENDMHSDLENAPCPGELAVQPEPVPIEPEKMTEMIRKSESEAASLTGKEMLECPECSVESKFVEPTETKTNDCDDHGPGVPDQPDHDHDHGSDDDYDDNGSRHPPAEVVGVDPGPQVDCHDDGNCGEATVVDEAPYSFTDIDVSEIGGEQALQAAAEL